MSLQWNDVTPQGVVASADINKLAHAIQANETDIVGKYEKPQGGIPKSDLSSEVQTSLNRADSAIQSHQDISGKEDKTNKVTSISSSSTDTQYPSAKCVYDAIQAGGGGGSVSSVNGKTGAVVLNKGDISLGNVDNTSDANKPISTAQQTALNAKQNTLVSGTNIKTINGESILGSGNISVGGGSGGGLTGVKVDGTALTVTDGYVNLQTQNGNYDSGTNGLVTENDLYTAEVERLDHISYYGQDIEPSFEGITIEWVGGANGWYEVTGYEQGFIGTQKVIPYKFNDGTHRENFVKAINSNAFKNGSFYDIILPNTIISIGDYAFVGCSNLSSITIPDSATSIGNDVFSNMASGFKVYCGKGSAMATYCETNNIPYVTNIDSEDIQTPQWKLLALTTLQSSETIDVNAITLSSLDGLPSDYLKKYKKFKLYAEFIPKNADKYNLKLQIQLRVSGTTVATLFFSQDANFGAVNRSSSSDRFKTLLFSEELHNSFFTTELIPVGYTNSTAQYARPICATTAFVDIASITDGSSILIGDLGNDVHFTNGSTVAFYGWQE